MGPAARVGNTSRTPPFVLIGLLLVLFFVAFKYWSLSSDRLQLQSELDTVLTSSRDLASEKDELSRSLDNIREQLRDAKKNLDSLSEQGKNNQAALETIRSESQRNQENYQECQKSLAECEGSMKMKDEDVQRIRGNLEAAQKQLETQRNECSEQIQNAQKAPCSPGDCESYLKDVLRMIGLKVNTNTLYEALSAEGKDYFKLLEGIPVNNQVETADNNVKGEQGNVQQQAGPDSNQDNQVNGKAPYGNGLKPIVNSGSQGANVGSQGSNLDSLTDLKQNVSLENEMGNAKQENNSESLLIQETQKKDGKSSLEKLPNLDDLYNNYPEHTTTARLRDAGSQGINEGKGYIKRMNSNARDQYYNADDVTNADKEENQNKNDQYEDEDEGETEDLKGLVNMQVEMNKLKNVYYEDEQIDSLKVGSEKNY